MSVTTKEISPAFNSEVTKAQGGQHLNRCFSCGACSGICPVSQAITEFDPRKIIRTITYDHPVLTREGVAAQKRQAEINGVNRTYFCGAYWRNGFHEDGVVSALAALEHFEERHGEQELHLRRAG